MPQTTKKYKTNITHRINVHPQLYIEFDVYQPNSFVFIFTDTLHIQTHTPTLRYKYIFTQKANKIKIYIL